MSEGQSMLKDSHLAAIEAAKEQSTSLLKNFYKVCYIKLFLFFVNIKNYKRKLFNSICRAKTYS